MVIFQFSNLPPCATVPSSLQARGRRPRDCNKGIFVLRERKREELEIERCLSLSPISLLRMNTPFIKNCEPRLIRGRKSIIVKQNFFLTNFKPFCWFKTFFSDFSHVQLRFCAPLKVAPGALAPLAPPLATALSIRLKLNQNFWAVWTRHVIDPCVGQLY